MPTLSLNEHQSIMEQQENADNVFSEDMINRAESYWIEEKEDFSVDVILYDAMDNEITRATFEDIDVALVVVSEIFDLDDVDMFDYKGVENDPVVAAADTSYGHG